MTLTPPAPVIPRDGWGRPLVTPAAGGKPVAYTRTTTFVSALEDRFALGKWEQRMVATGLANRPDLMLRAASLTGTDHKQALDDVCAAAKEAAAASAAATTGTALHALTETLDRCEEVPVIPEQYLADLEAYDKTTGDLTHEHIERFLVHDPLKVAGTPDRISRHQGGRYICDVKTGDIEWGALKIAMQLAVYARSQLYDPATGQRQPHDADVTRGIVIHLPAGQGRCDLYWFDLLAGWEACKVARDIREKRKIKFRDVAQPVSPGDQPAWPEVKPPGTAAPADTPKAAGPGSLAYRIARAKTAQDVRDLWRVHHREWTDELTAAAKQRIGELDA